MDPMMDESDEDIDLPPDHIDRSDEGTITDDDTNIKEEDAYVYGDPDDPVKRVLDVYLSEELEDHL